MELMHRLYPRHRNPNSHWLAEMINPTVSGGRTAVSSQFEKWSSSERNCFPAAQRKSERSRRRWTREENNKLGERLTVKSATPRGEDPGREERPVCCRSSSKTNLYCIKISRAITSPHFPSARDFCFFPDCAPQCLFSSSTKA